MHHIPLRLSTPQQLAQAPLIEDVRPRFCPSCRAVSPVDGSRVGMHGDGLCYRQLLWPDLQPHPRRQWLVWVRAVGRRFWCPVCGHGVRVHHPGIERGLAFGAATVALLFWLVGDSPLGQGLDEAAIYALFQGPLAEASSGRSGRPRWHALRRWALNVSRRWPAIVRRVGSWREGVEAALLAFAPGGDPEAVVLAALRGGLAM